jgi:general secretion pathway protein K
MRAALAYARRRRPVAGSCSRAACRGVALITALLVVSLATAAAVAMATQQQLDIRRTANLLHGEQAYDYALGAESWAMAILRRDAADNRTDTLADSWATALPPLPVEGGSIQGYVVDMQGRFNLNNLVGANGAISEPDLEYFRRLLENLELDGRLATVVADWIDKDIDTHFPDGAEDDAYLLEQIPYRAANRPMASISELRLVKGVDRDVFDRLSPYVCALPERTDINVNTAAAPVLRALHNELTEADAAALVTERGDKGYSDAAAFRASNALAGLEIDVGVGVASSYFMVAVEAVVGQGKARLFSLLKRDDNGLHALYRVRDDSMPFIVPVANEDA